MLVLIGGTMTKNSYASVDLEIIAEIESSNNPKAENKRSGARGLYQITPICLKHYNQSNDTQIGYDELFDPGKNLEIALWYFAWLESQGLSEIDQLIAYNWGIGNLRQYNEGTYKHIPRETCRYVNKYFQLKEE
jgi:soluble lytic murein transglycosylase-like protein